MNRGNMEKILDELEKLRRSHFVLDEDCWYSCPKSGHCCNDNAGRDCNCGADSMNIILDNIIEELKILFGYAIRFARSVQRNV